MWQNDHLLAIPQLSVSVCPNKCDARTRAALQIGCVRRCYTRRTATTLRLPWRAPLNVDTVSHSARSDHRMPHQWHLAPDELLLSRQPVATAARIVLPPPQLHQCVIIRVRYSRPTTATSDSGALRLLLLVQPAATAPNSTTAAGAAPAAALLYDTHALTMDSTSCQ